MEADGEARDGLVRGREVGGYENFGRIGKVNNFIVYTVTVIRDTFKTDYKLQYETDNSKQQFLGGFNGVPYERYCVHFRIN